MTGLCALVKVPAMFARGDARVLEGAIRAAQVDVDVASSAEDGLGNPRPRFICFSCPSPQDQERESLLLQLWVPTERQGVIGLDEVTRQRAVR